MNESLPNRTKHQSLVDKKDNAMIISLALLLLIGLMLFLGFQAVQVPNPLGENSPSAMFFFGIGILALIALGFSVKIWSRAIQDLKSSI